MKTKTGEEFVLARLKVVPANGLTVEPAADVDRGTSQPGKDVYVFSSEEFGILVGHEALRHACSNSSQLIRKAVNSDWFATSSMLPTGISLNPISEDS
nr:hypothetical protein [Streptomyces mangrovisoli]